MPSHIAWGYARTQEDLDRKIQQNRNAGKYATGRITAFGREHKRRREAARLTLITEGMLTGIDPVRLWEVESGFAPEFPLTNAEWSAVATQLGVPRALWDNELKCRR